MPTTPRTVCAARPSVEALAHDRLDPAARSGVHHHLESCEACRSAFRRITSGWLPHVRNYTILEQVGKGGFGVVYKAVHHQKQRIEALKVHFGRTPLRAAYFENEVHLIARLQHPNIATLYEANLGGSPPYYTMAFVEGRQLGDHLRASSLSLEGRIHLFRTIVRTIGYAHSQGVIHRDIKPQNIVVDAGGVPRIVDFGIGKMLGLTEPIDELAPHGSPEMPEGPIGTFGYIAPEQMSGGAVDSRADIYALGALLFHCVTGEPAKWATRADRLAAYLRERHVSRADDLAAIIGRCVETDPARRYQTCAELDRDLDNYLSAWTIAARRDRPPGYALARGLAYVLRHHPWAVRAPLMTTAALLLCIVWSGLDLRYYSAGGAGDDVHVIAFADSTVEALRSGAVGAPEGVRADDPRSWRGLDAQLLRRLAVAGPRVVVMDYFFRRPNPEHDGALADAIRDAGAPVLIGAAEFDRDGEPVGGVPALHEAAHAAGCLIGVRPTALPGEYIVPLVVERGGAPPFPGLAVAAYAAWRFPDSRARFAAAAGAIEIRYERRLSADGESRWRDRIDRVPVRDVHQPVSAAAIFSPGDRVYRGAVRAVAPGHWDGRVHRYEQVLAASDDQIRAWFEGRAVLIGQMRGGEDRYQLSDGQSLYGCQVQALALESMIGEALPVNLSRPQIAARALAACVVGTIFVLALRRIIRASAGWVIFAAVPMLACAGLAAAVAIARSSPERIALEAGMLLAGILTAAGFVLLAEALRERQLQLAPGANWSTGDPTLSSTLLAETRQVTAG
ncbi:MAG: protein kinase [Planctomycetia bacterium]|nr:MAG: protein kinase [Planctomycetia bacterium]